MHKNFKLAHEFEFLKQNGNTDEHGGFPKIQSWNGSPCCLNGGLQLTKNKRGLIIIIFEHLETSTGDSGLRTCESLTRESVLKVLPRSEECITKFPSVRV